MTTDPDLRRVLGLVVEADRPAVDPSTDLARARAAASVRNRRRFRTGLGALTAVVLLGAGSLALANDPNAPDDPAAPSAAPEPGVRLVLETLDATPYTFDLTPQGWSVQGQRPSAVTIAPDDGSTSENPDDFRGKLVILFDDNPVVPGRGVALDSAVEHDGRLFWVSDSDDYTTVSTETLRAEPDGVVRIQYPRDAGWDDDTMVRFLASVHVGPLAQHGLG
jgi:hypothetical protein